MTTPGATATRFAIDGVAPAHVERPDTPEAAAATLARLAAEGAAVVPFGGGVHQSLGRPPAKYDVALDLTGLDAIVEYEPADLTVTVQAGMTLRNLAATLAERGQAVTLESPYPERATVGGVLAAGLAGPLSHSLGGPRERLIGLRAALVDGGVVHGGGRVVKNVAGYDLPRLFVGSLGTLGVITEATFKLAALPPVLATVVLHPASVSAAFRIAAEIRTRNLPVRALEFAEADGAVTMLVDISARRQLVERLHAEVAEVAGVPVEVAEAGDHGQVWRAWQEAGREDTAAIVRVVAPPASLPGIVDALRASEGVRAQVRPGTGVIRLLTAAPSGAFVSAARLAAQRAGGHALIEHGPAALRRAIDPWPDVSAPEAMRRLRAQFDPKGTLNPGRFVEAAS